MRGASCDSASGYTACVDPLCISTQRETGDQFWWRRRGGNDQGNNTLKANCGVVPIDPSHNVRRVEGVRVKEHIDILQRCSIGWCRAPILNLNLAKELRSEQVEGVHVMGISKPWVLIIFYIVGIRQ
ncbi:hypothetical protein V6N12_010585 [Hibiscus sabdariffa]|uniref:Uncharacterized protein n=1 Tax=Hibiscus sabdariffa TaxID=183260 RepID=A0ABR2EKI1_9ROSI